MKFHFKGRDFLKLADYTPEEIGFLLDSSADMKRRWAAGVVESPLAKKSIALIFEKPSTRTRNSFQVGIQQLGGYSVYMRPDEMAASRGEPIKDTARVLDRYYDALVIRTFGQELVDEYAGWMKQPVINALTNDTHPCQVLADLLTMREKKGTLKGLKLCYLGMIWNMTHSLMVGCAQMGVDFYVGRPNGYEPNQEQFEIAQGLAEQAGSKVVFTESLEEAITDADIVYGMVWKSMGDPEHEKRVRDYSPYQIDNRVMGMAKADANFMHCLPAMRGEEVLDEVIEGPQSVVWDEAENRLHVQKAVMALVVP